MCVNKTRQQIKFQISKSSFKEKLLPINVNFLKSYNLKQRLKSNNRDRKKRVRQISMGVIFFSSWKNVIALDSNIFDFNCHAWFSFTTFELIIIIIFLTFMLNWIFFFIFHCWLLRAKARLLLVSIYFFTFFLLVHRTTKDIHIKQSNRKNDWEQHKKWDERKNYCRFDRTR